MTEYNTIRPHESLYMKTPSSIHVKSNRSHNEKKIAYEYPLHFKINKVYKTGASRWRVYNWL